MSGTTITQQWWNTRQIAHTTSGPQLHLFQQGEMLSASTLNANFMLLLSMVQGAVARAAAPNEDALDAIELVKILDERMGVFEEHVADEAAAVRARQYAPMTLVQALYAQIEQIAGPIMAQAAETAAHHRMGDALAERVAQLELAPPAPPAPTLEAFEKLMEEMARVRTVLPLLLRRIEQLERKR